MNYLIEQLFINKVTIENNRIIPATSEDINAVNQSQTEKVFSDKWTEVEQYKNVKKLYEFQFEWFLKLYGFDSEQGLKDFLLTKRFIIDTGCGLGYKAAWFASLSPQSTVIGIDISDALDLAAKNFSHLSNLFFLKSDIANTGIRTSCIDFVVCDQVIMHTESPQQTFAHLSDITSQGGEFACYVYSKKALPRELIDDYFRKETHNISNEEMWQFSEQLTELGKRLSALKVEIDSPDIPLLGIKGGKYDIQRFIYWNFLKCFWRDDWGFELSKSTNYDWYAPSNATRFSKQGFLELIAANKLEITFLHEEEACYSGRFLKPLVK